MNTAVCSAIKEQEDVAARRWRRRVSPRTAGLHQAAAGAGRNWAPTSHPPSRRRQTCPAPQPWQQPGSPPALALLPFYVVVASRRGTATTARLVSWRKPLPRVLRGARRVRTASERSQKYKIKSLLRVGRLHSSSQAPPSPLRVGRVWQRRDGFAVPRAGPRRTQVLFSKPKQMGPNLQT